MDARKLVVLVEEKTGVPSVGPVALPTLSDVLYEPPGELGGKRCANCRLWAERDERCTIIDQLVPVTYDMVCGYHVDGEPQMYATALTGTAKLSAELAGLQCAPPRGTSCSGCRYYEALDANLGVCRAVASERGGCARVDALGCCSRWRAPVPILAPPQVEGAP